MHLPPHALELVAPHCDIKERLDAVPPSARVRGIYFSSIDSVLERQGRLAAFRELYPSKVRWSLGFHPLKQYLLRLACGGAVLVSPEELHEGMYEICRANATSFAQSLLGRTLIRLLSRDPVRLAEQGLAARRQTHSYGHWSIVRHGPTDIEMVYRNEYMWIESAILGAAAGTFQSCGVSPALETTLIDKYNGSTRIRW